MHAVHHGVFLTAAMTDKWQPEHFKCGLAAVPLGKPMWFMTESANLCVPLQR